MTSRISRRRFVRGTAAMTGAGFWLGSQSDRVLGRSPNERVSIACVGVGGKGSSDTDGAARYGEIAALCDIDDRRLKDKARKYPDAKTFHDYRELLSVMGDKVDAVVVSTADHTHAAAGVGNKGRLYSPGDSGDVQRLEVKGQVKTPEPIIERLGSEAGPDENQKREWIRAIQGGAVPLSNFDYASVLTEAMLLGNVAVRVGKPIEYDGDKGTITNHADAARLVAPPPRAGWEL